MSALDDISAELQARHNVEEEDEYKFTLAQEIGLIVSRIIYILVVASALYFIPGLIVMILMQETFDYMLGRIIFWSFVIGAITGVLSVGRGYAASGLYMASAIRQSWTGKRPEPGAFAFFRDFAFGVKWDTILFYGSVFVFTVSYLIR